MVRRTERLRFTPPENGASYSFECLDFAAVERKLNAYYAEFSATVACKAAAHQHDGANSFT